MNTTPNPQINTEVKTARVVEIFTSIQGEGLLLGTPMTFVRFGGCNLRCTYCDEPDALPMNSGSERNVEDICAAIIQDQEETRPADWISLTGGEPLMQGAFLEHLIPKLKQLEFRLYLETSGLFHEALAKIAPKLDLISMDIKLASTVQGIHWFSRHRKFLSIAPEKTTVKIVLTDTCDLAEVAQAVEMLKEFPQVPLVILQPATPTNGVERPAAEFLKRSREMAWSHLKNPIRVMPQYHPIWKLP